MTTVVELDDLVRTARGNGCNDITLLKCTSSCTSTPEGSNLLIIPHIKDWFKCNVGLSDHTLGIGVAIAIVALGATVIKKHFILSRSDGGVDAVFFIGTGRNETKAAWQALGQIC